MAKLQSLNWPQDPLAAATLTTLVLDAAEILVEFIPDDRLREAADRIDAAISNTAQRNAKSRSALVGAETARSALAQIVRR